MYQEPKPYSFFPRGLENSTLDGVISSLPGLIVVPQLDELNPWHLTVTLSLFSGMPGAPPTLSGLQEPDYPSVESVSQSPSLRASPALTTVQQRSAIQKVPLPEALVTRAQHLIQRRGGTTPGLKVRLAINNGQA